MSNSQTKINYITLLRQKVDDLLKPNSSRSELILPRLETLKLLDEIEDQQLELEKQNKELLLAQLSHQNKEHLYGLFPNGCLTLSNRGEIIEINFGAANLLNEKRAKLIGSLFEFFVTSDTKPIFIDFLQDVFKNRVEEGCELILCSASSKPIYVSLTGTIKECEDQCYVTIIDISERKGFEAKLQNERDLYQDLINNQPAGIYQIRVFPKNKWENDAWKSSEHPPYRMELASDRFCEILGISRCNFEENPAIISDLVHPQDILEFTQKNVEANAKLIPFKWEGRLLIREKIVWVHLESIPRSIPNGEVLWTGILYDITSQKYDEEALKENEEKLTTLFSSMTEMVVMHELVFDEQSQVVDYRLIDCNNAFTVITGIRKEDAIGKLATEVYHTEVAPYLELYARVAMTGKSYEFNSYFAPFDKHFLISVVSYKENHFATITNDITDMQHIQEAITEKNNELESYLYVASHDLRSPLINIQGFSKRLQKQLDELIQLLSDCKLELAKKADIDRIVVENMPKTQNFILSNVSKMDALINGLLQISRTGRLAMTVKKVDMSQLFNKIIAAYDFQIAELLAQVKIGDISDCFGDENQLNQLFSNIIDNALKYRDSNRQLEIEIASEIRYDKVIYTISDTGIGIKSRDIERIWDVFYRVDSVSSEAGEGIGLSITKRIANKHKGKIWVESEVGKGSIFYVELQKNEFLE
jgi:signal transduction histidine kinase